MARIERSEVRPSLEVLAAIGVALGADLSLRYFPGAGPRLHDRFQALMVETLLRSIDPRWHPDLEVPITKPSRGVIDVVLADPITLATELYSELRRLEQQIRWSAAKAEGLALRIDGNPLGPARSVSRLLILRSTMTMRDIARRYEATLAAAYPARTKDIMRALTSPDEPWSGSGIAWMQVHGSVATLMRFPPAYVDLGR